MDIKKFLLQISDLGITFEVRDGQLYSRGNKGAIGPELQDRIRESKHEIIRFLTNAFKKEGDIVLRLPRSPGVELPLSFAQQRLWFLDQFEPNSAFYNMPGMIRLSGELNLAAFSATLNEVVRRHESLRTTFANHDGMPVQVVVPDLSLQFPVTDLSDVLLEEQEAKVASLAREEALAPFDLITGPLIRASLLRLSASEHVVLFTLHHIISDGWSMGVLVKEVAALYGAYVEHRPSPLPTLPIQYADFAYWQRQWLNGDVLDNQLSYWKRQLADAPVLLSLPTDYPRPPIQSYRGTTFSFTIDRVTTSALYAVSAKGQATLFVTLFAAFNVLLSRYTGQSDICIGTPIANRNRTEIEQLIGFFVNTLVLRNHVDGNVAFTTLLQQARSIALDAYAHQDVPLEQLVEALKPERDLSHAPLFQVMLALENAPAESLKLPGLTLQTMAVDSVSAKFDLSLNVIEEAGRLLCSLEYSTDLFEEATILRMASHFNNLLDGIIANPSCLVRQLPMLGDQEQQQMLVGWNSTTTIYPRNQTVHQLFEVQVALTPDHIAVVFEGTELNYAELNTRANQLAHHLRFLGVGPDVLVGICVERSLEMVVGLLAILKAGGAYLPLDSADPAERLAYMLDDAKPMVLLTHSHLLGSLPLANMPVLCLDLPSFNRAVVMEEIDNPLHIALPSHLAYAIYTSGSTGNPKGVMIEHGNLINLACVQAHQLRSFGSQSVLQFANLNFDMSVEEIFPALISGARLIIRPAAMLTPDREFLRLIELNQIDTLNLPMSFWHEWTNLLNAEQSIIPTCVKVVSAGGEKASSEQYKKWAYQTSHLSGQWINAYGPTESTVNATHFDMAFGQQFFGK
ncbi:AMP-binding protein, partial [Collimonas pratensis]|uniref:non-ribosomal peptide synthetase n=1 Tax=Collimonas pratensis TaxID=279113 RepID=UPI00143D3203